MRREFPVTDVELNAMFMGLVRLVKQKVEFDYRQHAYTDYERLLALYQSKVKECNALKNKLLALMSEQ